MLFYLRGAQAALWLLVAGVAVPAVAQVTYEDVNGIRYQVTRQTVPRSVPVTKTQEQQQTTYRQQVVTENVQHQQVYQVPVTQYQVVSQLHGRWNPFVTPYWTHSYQPVTTYQTQVGTVQIPVTRVSWAPETRTVQTPVTTWETHNQEIVMKTPIGPSTSFGGASNTALASSSAGGSAPSATISPLSSAPAASVASRTSGGEMMNGDVPRQPSAFSQPDPSRYR